MSKSFIIDAVRSPIGLKNGDMIGIRPDDLTAQVLKGLLAHNPDIKPEMIEDEIGLSESIIFLVRINVLSEV